MLVERGFEYKGYKIGDKAEVVTSEEVGEISGFCKNHILLGFNYKPTITNGVDSIIGKNPDSKNKSNELVIANDMIFNHYSWFDFEEIRVLEEGNKEPEKVEKIEKVDKIKPNYYKLKINGTDCEVDDVMKALGLDMESVYISNVLKYVSRYKGKNGLEDLKKAQEYLGRLIKKMEEK